MSYWGINALNHGSSIALFSGSKFKLITSADNQLDHSDIRYALEYYGAPDRIFWYEQPWLKKARQLYAGQYKTAFTLSSLPTQYLKQLRLDYAPITCTPHHASHAAAGYYTSPFNHCAVVVLDAIGEFESATIWHARHGEMKKVWSRSYPHSLGLFYSAFTKLIGLTPIQDEYLLQQMSDQGDPMRYYWDVKNYMDGVVHAGKNMHRGIQDWPHTINNLSDQCDIAAAVQTVFIEQVHGVMKKAKQLTGADSLVYMGGCAMNRKANQTVVEPKFKHIWSLPDPGDASSSIGAVLYHTQQRLDHQWDPVKHIAITV